MRRHVHSSLGHIPQACTWESTHWAACATFRRCLVSRADMHNHFQMLSKLLCAPTPAGTLTESTSTSGHISRADVAQCVVKALFSKKADGKVGATGTSLLLRCGPSVQTILPTMNVYGLPFLNFMRLEVNKLPAIRVS